MVGHITNFLRQQINKLNRATKNQGRVSNAENMFGVGHVVFKQKKHLSS